MTDQQDITQMEDSPFEQAREFLSMVLLHANDSHISHYVETASAWMDKAEEENKRLRTQLDWYSSAIDMIMKYFGNTPTAEPHCLFSLSFMDREIARLKAETDHLYVQVEELSKYPEEAVRAMFEYLFPAPIVEKFLEINGDKLAAIFKEKQGVGK